MKMVWKKREREQGKKAVGRARSAVSDLPFDAADEESTSGKNEEDEKVTIDHGVALDSKTRRLSESFRCEGNLLAEEGRFREALTKWEAALLLTPDEAVLHEQKAQVLLELGDDWNALKAASRATELEPSWPEAWTTLARAQLNLGEPEESFQSFEKALSLKPGSEDIEAERESVSRLVKRRKQLQLSGSPISRVGFSGLEAMGHPATAVPQTDDGPGDADCG
ncbi:tetratricopeptide repeat (TPR)-like superfamily protein [Wolffia australiana]